MLISTKNIIPNFLGGSAFFCKRLTSNVSTFLFLSFFLPCFAYLSFLFLKPCILSEMSSVFCCCWLTYREMWENSPGSSVLHSHSSYREALPVYQEDTYPRFIYCTLVSHVSKQATATKNMLWQTSVRNCFFLYRDFPPFSSSATLKLQMQKWSCRRCSCGYWHHFWVVSY